MKTALIAGATGLCGKSLLFNLLQNKNYGRIFILVRKELAIKDHKLTQIVFDYNNEDDYLNLPEADIVFCCLGTTIKKAGSKEAFLKVDYEYPLKLAQACSKKGYTSFSIITAMGANSNSTFFYNKVKGQIEDSLKSISFKNIYICRPSLLLGDRSEFRLGEYIGQFFAKFISPFLIGGAKKYRAIEANTIAKAMIQKASEPSTGLHLLNSEELQSLGDCYKKE